MTSLLLNRWRIDGTLTTRSPVHIGTGDSAPHPELIVERDGNQPRSVEVATIDRDINGLPVIPGSALKGVVRSGLSPGPNREVIDHLFGFESRNEMDSGVGSKIEFWFATLDRQLSKITGAMSALPYWDETRFSAIRAGVSIDRVYRTSADEKLYHHEFVPPGAVFRVTVTGRNLSEEEVAIILFALDGFNDSHIQIGAHTADGYGRMTWTLDTVRMLGSDDDAADWLNSGGFGYENLPHAKEPESIRRHLPEGLCYRADTTHTKVLRLKLTFDGPFLVQHPVHKGMKDAQGETSDTPDSVPLRDATGKPELPVFSFLGSLRTQAERILRTLQLHACNPGVSGCDPVRSMDDLRAIVAAPDGVERFCLACRLFGGAGWKTPIQADSFELKDSGIEYNQEFVAIDRFTGGGAKHKKFSTRSVWSPVFGGSLIINLTRLYALYDRTMHVTSELPPLAELGLLALTLRDLKEGDIRFGHGASHGYGCATVTGVDDILTATRTAADIDALRTLASQNASRRQEAI